MLLVGNFLSAELGNHCVCEELATNLQTAGLQVLTTSSHKARLRRLVDMVSTILRRRHDYSVANVDVYSGLAFGLAEAACLALRALGKPFVLTLHGGNLPNFSQRWPRRVGRVLASADLVTTPSSYLREQMATYRDDIQLIPNTLNLSAYNYRHRDQVSPHFIWVRSFHEIYNPTLAVKVVAELAPQWPELKLTMVGPDKGDGSLQATQELAQELGVSDHIRFTGGVPKADIPGLLDVNDVFLNTTTIDNTPVSVLEAMACGLCVISTNVGGIPHLINDRINGMLVGSDDEHGMANSADQLLQNRELTSSLSENSRKYAEKMDWESILPQWIEVFSKLKPQN